MIISNNTPKKTSLIIHTRRAEEPDAGAFGEGGVGRESEDLRVGLAPPQPAPIGR